VGKIAGNKTFESSGFESFDAGSSTKCMKAKCRRATPSKRTASPYLLFVKADVEVPPANSTVKE
jgi:hypothetical protein